MRLRREGRQAKGKRRQKQKRHAGQIHVAKSQSHSSRPSRIPLDPRLLANRKKGGYRMNVRASTKGGRQFSNHQPVFGLDLRRMENVRARANDAKQNQLE